MSWGHSSFCKYFIVIFLVVLNSSPSSNAIDEIKIGVLIRHRGLEEPLNRTLEMLNNDNSVLSNTPLKALVELIETDNSYQASAAICRLLEQKVWAIIGPQSIQLAPIIQSITSYYHIPVIFINWQPYSYYNLTQLNNNNRQTNDKQDKKIGSVLDYTINLYPQADLLSGAYLDLIKHKNWKTFSLIYDSSEDFVLVKDIFEMSFQDTNINIQKISLPDDYPEVAGDDGDGASVENTHLTNSEDYKPNSDNNESNANNIQHLQYCNFDPSEPHNKAYTKLMKDLRKRGVENLVLSMPLNKVCKVLREAVGNQLLTFYNDYIIANLDTHLLNLTQLQPIMTNISGFTILDPEGQQTDFKQTKLWLGKRPVEFERKLLSTEYSMMSDSISLLAYTLDEFINSAASGSGRRPIEAPQTEAGCENSRAWEHGADLMGMLKTSVRKGGYTGDIKFDAFGQRTDFELNYIIHRNNSFKRVATWNKLNGLGNDHKNPDDFGLEAIKNKTLIVTIALTPPYVQHKKNWLSYSGNERYEGYCIDLMNKLARKLQFNYKIQEVGDGQYGKIQNGSWTGMVRELLDWKADLAIVDLTITKERQSAVDFTHPFMTLGIAIMFQKPKMKEAEMYSFLMPFSKEVWLSMWSAYVGISLAIWLISRLSPLEWKNPHPCVDNMDERDKENEIHSIGAGLWFTIGSLMQQGSDLAPRSPSVRALASVWYFFTLILISSYTANFAAFLTASRLTPSIESAEDLSKQTKIDYGCKDGGATQAFFSTSNHSTYRRMWNFMESRKSQGVFPDNNDKGISMVKKGNYAFLMESTSLDYMVQRDCELTQIGGLLDNKGYGIALRKRSPFRAPLSKSIVELNEDGELQDLKNKWWNPEQPCVEEKDSASGTSELGIDKVGGVFVMLGVGVFIACIAAILEFIWKSLKTSKDERETISTMLMLEIMRILKCGPSKRPAPTSSHYNKSKTSQPSTIDLNTSANSLNKSGTYVTRRTLNGAELSAPNNNYQNGFVQRQNLGLYGNTPLLFDNGIRLQMNPLGNNELDLG